MKVEWSADALADLDRFAAFLHRHYPALANVVAREIIAHGFFSPDALPDGVSRATRARIAEVFGGAAVSEVW